MKFIKKLVSGSRILKIENTWEDFRHAGKLSEKQRNTTLRAMVVFTAQGNVIQPNDLIYKVELNWSKRSYL
jgi:hypothetical protein